MTTEETIVEEQVMKEELAETATSVAEAAMSEIKRTAREPLAIVKYPAESLLQRSAEVESLSQVEELIQDLLYTMLTLKWGVPVGLAAPQVGKNVRLFIAEGEVYINPEIIWKTKAPESLDEEGCYSLDDDKFNYKKWRSQSITLKWKNELWEDKEQRFNGFHARVIQHELDHLNGILCNAE